METLICGYRILSRINAGGMGTTYLAEHELLKTKAVLKTPHDSWRTDDRIKDSFINEARILSQLKHPNIVGLIHFDTHPEYGYVILMDYVEGKTLAELLAEKGQHGLEADKVKTIFNGLLDAFHYAHSKGIVHRDIKPDNIIINNDFSPVVLDFGIASMDDLQSDNYFFQGTPSYTSPEQVIGVRTLDQRSDIYSLGVILYMLLLGKHPYENRHSHFAMMEAITKDPLPRILNDKIQSDSCIDDVLQKATEKNPDKRYKNCTDFKTDFEKIDFGFLGLIERNNQHTNNHNPTLIDTAKYDEVRSFSCGRAAVKKRNMFNGWGFIDERGNEIIPCQFEQVSDFNPSGQSTVFTDKTVDYMYTIDVFGRITNISSMLNIKSINVNDIELNQFMRDVLKEYDYIINQYQKKAIQQQKRISVPDGRNKEHLEVNLNELQFFSFCHHCGNDIRPYLPRHSEHRDGATYRCATCGTNRCIGLDDTVNAICSVCGDMVSSYAENHCPNCGASKYLFYHYLQDFSPENQIVRFKEFENNSARFKSNMDAEMLHKVKNLPKILPPVYFNEIADHIQLQDGFSVKLNINIAWATPFYYGLSVINKLGEFPFVIDLNLNKIDLPFSYCGSDFRMGFAIAHKSDSSLKGYDFHHVYIARTNEYLSMAFRYFPERDSFPSIFDRNISMSNLDKGKLLPILEKNTEFDCIIGFFHQAKLYVVGLTQIKNMNTIVAFYEKTIIAVLDDDKDFSNLTPTLKFDYDEMRPFSCGRAAVRKGRLWGFVDEWYKLIIPYTWESVGDFENNICTVRASMEDTHDYVDIININGETIGTYNTVRDYFSLEDVYDEYLNKIQTGMGWYVQNQINSRWGFVYDNLWGYNLFFSTPRKIEYFEYGDFVYKKCNNFFFKHENLSDIEDNVYSIVIIREHILIRTLTLKRGEKSELIVDINEAPFRDITQFTTKCKLCGADCTRYAIAEKTNACSEFCYWGLDGFKEECEKYYSEGGQRIKRTEMPVAEKVMQHYGLILFNWIDRLWKSE